MRNLASKQITGCEILNNDYYNLEPFHPLDQDINQDINQDTNHSDEGLTLETSAFLPFTVANLYFQPSC